MPRPCEVRALVMVLLTTAPAPLSAQGATTLVGPVGGYTRTSQTWNPSVETQDVAGLLLGAFVDVTTPLAWLSGRGEVAYTQRGSDVVGDVAGQPLTGGVRTDYLTWTVQVRAALPLGRVRVGASMGVADDIVMRSRLDPVFAQVLVEEGATVFGWVAGAGVGVWVTERLFAEAEARIVRHLQDAYSGDFISVRSSSHELLARLAIPIRR